MKEHLIEMLRQYTATFRVKADAARELDVSSVFLTGVLGGYQSASLEKLISLVEKSGTPIYLTYKNDEGNVKVIRGE